MVIATLSSRSIDDPNKVTILDSGTLYYIDSITGDFKDQEDLKNSAYYRERVSSGEREELVLTYVRNNKEKKELTLLFDDKDPIRIRTSSLEEFKSEVENSRKLLLNSKKQMFLKSFVINKNLIPTTSATVKMTIDEYRLAKKEGYQVTAKDGEYRIPISEVLRYRLNHQKLGLMRLLIEDTLEVWKNNLLNMRDEDLYFYSRELRLLINEYNYRKIPRRAVVNLEYDENKLTSSMVIKKDANFKIQTTLGLRKRKIINNLNVA